MKYWIFFAGFFIKNSIFRFSTVRTPKPKIAGGGQVRLSLPEGFPPPGRGSARRAAPNRSPRFFCCPDTPSCVRESSPAPCGRTPTLKWYSSRCSPCPRATGSPSIYCGGGRRTGGLEYLQHLEISGAGKPGGGHSPLPADLEKECQLLGELPKIQALRPGVFQRDLNSAAPPPNRETGPFSARFWAHFPLGSVRCTESCDFWGCFGEL